MKKLLLGATLFVSVAGVTAQELSTNQAATAAAVADSVTTYVGVAAGAAEANPLVSPTLGGVVLLAAAKLGAIEYIDRSNRSDAEKRNVKRSAVAVWTGLSVSNVCIVLSMATPVALVAGVASGAYLWTAKYSDDKKVPAKTEQILARAD